MEEGTADFGSLFFVFVAGGQLVSDIFTEN